MSETAIGAGQNVKEVSYRNFVDWRAQSVSFDVMAAIGSTPWDLVLDSTDQLFRFKAAIVSASFFDLMGVSPQLGRSLTASDDVRGASRVLVLSDPLWRQQFGGDPKVIGRQVVVSDQPFTIVGVMPSDFAYPAGVQAWTPVVPALASANARWKVDTLEARHFGLLAVVGRLTVGVSAQQATTELDAIVRQLSDSQHQSAGALAVSVTPLLDEIFGPMRVGLILLFAMVGFVLLIACANVSSLVLARASTFEPASAVRIALGARRLDLIRESVVEMAIVTSVAGFVGIFLAAIGLRPLLAMAPSSLRLEIAEVDSSAVVFAAGLCTLMTLLCGLVPAVKMLLRRVGNLNLLARADDRPHRAIGRDVLTATQMAFATTLVIGAALLVRSFDQLRRIDLGFDAQQVLTADVEPQASTAAAYRLIYDAIIERVSALPGVEAVGATYLRPLAQGRFGLDSGYLLEGQRIDRPDDWKDNATLNAQAVTAGYFDALRIPLRRGRFFSSRDSQDAAAVAIVSETTASRLWPGTDPIGQRLSVASGVTERGEYPMQTVVGVVAEVRYRGIDDRRLDIYLPSTQTQHRVKHLMVRTSGDDPNAVAASVRAAVAEITGRAVVENVSSMDRIVTEAAAPWRFSMALMVGLAALGLVLAVTGLFSLVAFSVARRRRELSVRLAIGASPASVMRLVLWQGTRSTIVGLSVGVALSLALANQMTPLLFQVPPRHALTFVVAAGLLGVTALLASYLAARRVVGLDPLQVVRSL